MSEYVLGQYGIVKKKDPEKVVVITNKDNVPNDWNNGYGKPCWVIKKKQKNIWNVIRLTILLIHGNKNK